MNAASGEPVAQLVIVGGDREHHAQVEGLAAGVELLDHRLQRVGLDRMLRFAVDHGHIGFHLLPDGVRHRDGIAIEVHGEGRNDVGLGAKADGGANRLAGEHVRAVQLTVDDTVQQHLPVGLGFERDIEAFIFEKALFVGNGQGRHVGELDEAKLQFFFLGFGSPSGHRYQLQQGRASEAGNQCFQQRTASLAHDSSLNRETKKRRNGRILCMSRASTVDAFVNSSRSPPLATRRRGTGGIARGLPVRAMPGYAAAKNKKATSIQWLADRASHGRVAAVSARCNSVRRDRRAASAPIGSVLVRLIGAQACCS